MNRKKIKQLTGDMERLENGALKVEQTGRRPHGIFDSRLLALSQ